MSNREEFSNENIQQRKVEAWLAFTMFDITKRKIYLHCNLEEPEEPIRAPHTATRSVGHWYGLITASCSYCHAHHTCPGRTAYLEWYSKLPFHCEHNGKITSSQVEPDGDIASTYPHCYMPSQLRKMDPEIVSTSSAGLPLVNKLRRDLQRINTTFQKVMGLMGALINFVRV